MAKKLTKKQQTAKKLIDSLQKQQDKVRRKLTHEEYWTQRTDEAFKYADRKDIDFFKQLQDVYAEEANKLSKDIFDFYNRFAEDEGISLDEAQQRLQGVDLSDYRANATKYREQAEKDPELLKRLNEQYRASRVSRLEALELDMTYQLGLMQQNLSVLFEEHLKDIAQYTYKTMNFGVSSHGTLNAPALKNLMQSEFHGYNYSRQLWGNVDDLAKQLKRTFKRGFTRGLGARQMANEIRAKFNNKQHHAETLIRTDGSMIINNATLQRYAEAGLKYVRILVKLDERTTDVCKKHHKDNKRYLIADIIKNPILPAHFNCRSTYIPDEEELYAEVEALE